MKRKPKIDLPPERGGKVAPIEFVLLHGRRTWPADTVVLVFDPITGLLVPKTPTNAVPEAETSSESQ